MGVSAHPTRTKPDPNNRRWRHRITRIKTLPSASNIQTNRPRSAPNKRGGKCGAQANQNGLELVEEGLNQLLLLAVLSPQHRHLVPQVRNQQGVNLKQSGGGVKGKRRGIARDEHARKNMEWAAMTTRDRIIGPIASTQASATARNRLIPLARINQSLAGRLPWRGAPSSRARSLFGSRCTWEASADH